jgi:PleD family two-component response regulator
MTSQTAEVRARMLLIRILVVDDVEDWRVSVSSMLRADPSFEVFEASDGLKAVQAAEKLQPTVVCQGR